MSPSPGSAGRLRLNDNVLHAIEVQPATRCALCHDELAESLQVCAECGTTTHPACADELGDCCPTLGCSRRFAFDRPLEHAHVPATWTVHGALRLVWDFAVVLGTLAVATTAIITGGLFVLFGLFSLL